MSDNRPDDAEYYAVIDGNTYWYKLTNDGLVRWSGEWRQFDYREMIGVTFEPVDKE